jgi:Rrf2 family protein
MLSKKSKYAINALVYLAKNSDKDHLVRIGDIAAAEKIPQKFLEAILLDLRRAGILQSKQGKNGGYYLLKSPDDVNVADILRYFDGAIGLLPCATHKYFQRCDECKDENICGIRFAFQELRDQTVNFLKQTTLTDLIRRETELRDHTHTLNIPD